MSKPQEPPISNLVLGGLGALFVVTVSILGGLFYSLRPKKIVVEPAPEPVATAPAQNTAITPDASAESTPTFRIAARPDEVAAPQEPAAAPTQPSAPAETAAPATTEPAAVASADNDLSLEERLRKNASAGNLVNAKDSNDLVPELNGMSYTAKKAAANGGDAYATNKPAAKKAEPKKVIPPVTPPPAAAATPAKTPAKPEPAKPAVVAKTEPPKSTAPATPAPLTAAELAKFNVSKSPVYVLKDGRRLRALMAKDDGVTITIRNEVGASISFKKADVKEIIRS